MTDVPDFERIARAAIEAMREPTRPMAFAAWAYLDEIGENVGVPVGALFNRMIDAALKD